MENVTQATPAATTADLRPRTEVWDDVDAAVEAATENIERIQRDADDCANALAEASEFLRQLRTRLRVK